MQFFVSFAAGLVTRARPGGIDITGSCAAYTSTDIAVTAAHCVPEHPDRYYVLFPGTREPREPIHIERHPTADLALLRLPPTESHAPPDQFYLPPPDSLEEGGDFYGAGFPVEGTTDGLPVPRTFKGHFQRYFGYEAPDGRNYFAGEMSIPAPAGLSGGGLTYTRAARHLAAIVTTNHDSWVTLDRTEEVERDGVKYRDEVRRVVSYGIAAMAHPHEDWLAEHSARA
jgi:hypothetical protein